jgi:hypothetical protein
MNKSDLFNMTLALSPRASDNIDFFIGEKSEISYFNNEYNFTNFSRIKKTLRFIQQHILTNEFS